jgi:hypothetical protein
LYKYNNKGQQKCWPFWVLLLADSLQEIQITYQKLAASKSLLLSGLLKEFAPYLSHTQQRISFIPTGIS